MRTKRELLKILKDMGIIIKYPTQYAPEDLEEMIDNVE